jgi:hypothetical protein
MSPSDAIPDLAVMWPTRLVRVRRSQARTVTLGMTRPPRDPDERAFLAARGGLGPFTEVSEQAPALAAESATHEPGKSQPR